MPIISGGSMSEGREALSLAITSSESAICLTCFGETKLTASMWRKPATTSSFKYSAFSSVGMKSGKPCHASRGHSISLICSVISRTPLENEVEQQEIESQQPSCHCRPLQSDQK